MWLRLIVGVKYALGMKDEFQGTGVFCSLKAKRAKPEEAAGSKPEPLKGSSSNNGRSEPGKGVTGGAPG